MNIYATRRPSRLTDQQINRYLAKIPVERQKKVRKFFRQEDAIRSLCGSLLIKYVVQKELTMCNIIFSYNKNGKPFIDKYPKFHFNISHSYDWIVCATDNIEVGIDIEKIKEIDLDIAKNFFTTTEYTKIKEKSSHQQLSCFYEYWTMKESFLKNIGKGLSMPLNSFCIKEVDGEYITGGEYSSVYFFNQLHLDEEYKLAVCSKKKILDPEIQFVDFIKFDRI